MKSYLTIFHAEHDTIDSFCSSYLTSSEFVYIFKTLHRIDNQLESYEKFHKNVASSFLHNRMIESFSWSKTRSCRTLFLTYDAMTEEDGVYQVECERSGHISIELVENWGIEWLSTKDPVIDTAPKNPLLMRTSSRVWSLLQ